MANTLQEMLVSRINLFDLRVHLARGEIRHFHGLPDGHKVRLTRERLDMIATETARLCHEISDRNFMALICAPGNEDLLTQRVGAPRARWGEPLRDGPTAMDIARSALEDRHIAALKERAEHVHSVLWEDYTQENARDSLLTCLDVAERYRADGLEDRELTADRIAWLRERVGTRGEPVAEIEIVQDLIDESRILLDALLRCNPNEDAMAYDVRMALLWMPKNLSEPSPAPGR